MLAAEEHLQHLREVLSKLQEHGKCLLGVPEVQFLGHMVSARGIIPVPVKVAAICAFPRPGTAGDGEFHQGSCKSSQAPDGRPTLSRRLGGQGGLVHADAAGFRGQQAADSGKYQVFFVC